MLLSLTITAWVVHSLGGYETKLKMMQYPGTGEARQAAALSHQYERTAQEAYLCFLDPAHFSLSVMFSGRVIRSDKTLWSLPCSPALPFTFILMGCFPPLHALCISERKRSNILTLCPGKGCMQSLATLSNSPLSRRNSPH